MKLKYDKLLLVIEMDYLEKLTLYLSKVGTTKTYKGYWFKVFGYFCLWMSLWLWKS